MQSVAYVPTITYTYHFPTLDTSKRMHAFTQKGTSAAICCDTSSSPPALPLSYQLNQPKPTYLDIHQATGLKA
jgi:hypothetical protein